MRIGSRRRESHRAHSFDRSTAHRSWAPVWRRTLRFCSVTTQGATHIAVSVDGKLISLNELLPGTPADMASFIASAPSIQQISAALGRKAASCEILSDRAEYLPAVSRPGKIICVGLNYRDHAEELGKDIPDYPLLFMRGARSIVGHGQALIRPAVSNEFDYEAELGVVIGKPARNVKADAAYDHVFGVSCFNDGSIRDYQFRTTQLTPGKNFDKTGAFGPEIVTLDELPAKPDELDIVCRLNGTVVQKSNTSQHIFGVPKIIELLSEIMTLEPGDVIAMGTTGGVGFARSPQLWMKPGDEVEVEIEGVGTLRNPVVADAGRTG